MRKLLLSTAILGAATVPALAQDQSVFREAPEDMEIRASEYMGMRLYATPTTVEGEEAAGLQEGWEDIGEISDIVMSRDGQVQAVLVDIGGFLGIGERTVALSSDSLRFVSDSETAEDASDFFLVVNANREVLEAAPEYQATQNEGMTAEQAATETEQAIDEGGEAVAAAGAEIADEAADAGEEVTEEVAQTGMTDTQEDSAEVADANADMMEESAEETADQAEMVAETTMTEGEMAAEETAEAATTETTTETEGNVVVTTVEGGEAETTTVTAETEQVPSGEAGAIIEGGETEQMAEGEAMMTEEDMIEAELTSAETMEGEGFAREGFMTAGAEDLTADRLQGAAVYDVNDERIGEVGEILLSEDGQVQSLVIDVGGFLGLGEKPVAMAMDSLDILRQDGGEEIRIYVSQTQEELEAMERYEAQ